MAHTQKKPVAVGHVDPRFPGMRTVVVRVEDELHEDIRQRAFREETSFSEQVRCLLEWGLDAASKAA